ncbi:hypothetical protein D3C81_07050 [compost metagenome]
MKETLVSLIFVLVLYLFRKLILHLNKDPFKNKKCVEGTVMRLEQLSNGVTTYCITFEDNGEILTGNTVYYSEIKPKYNTNDLVSIQYIKDKDGNVIVSIVGMESLAYGNSLDLLSQKLLIAIIVFIVIALIFFIRSIF